MNNASVACLGLEYGHLRHLRCRIKHVLSELSPRGKGGAISKPMVLVRGKFIPVYRTNHVQLLKHLANFKKSPLSVHSLRAPA